MAERRGRGRLETNLCRSPLWDTGGVGPPEALSFSARSLLGEFGASQRLTGLDLTVLAFILERWSEGDTGDLLHPAEFTLYELGVAIYGREPDGKERRMLRAALLRLYRVEIDLVGYDATLGQRGARFARKSRLVYDVLSELDTLDDPEQRQIGGLRGSTFAVLITPWLGKQVRAGYVTYLDFQVMRRLRGVAARLWVYLEAEDWRPRRGETEVVRWVTLSPEAFGVFGMSYARDRDARRHLAEAGERIVAADARYSAVVVESRDERWILRALRLFEPGAAKRAASRRAFSKIKLVGRERNERRQLVTESLDVEEPPAPKIG